MGVDAVENVSSIVPGSKLFELGLRCDAALPLSCGPDFLVQSLSDEACLGIGALLTASTRAPLCVDGHPPQLPGGDSDEIAADYRRRVRDCLLVQGLPDESVPPPGSCLSAILKTEDTVVGGGRVTVRPYDRSLLNVVQPGHTTVPLESVVDCTTRQMLDSPEDFILREESEFPEELGGFAPYCDPAMKDRAVYLEFIKDLYRARIVCFRLRRKGVVAPFFVTKKDGSLRLVIDCRGVNMMVHPPPKTYLSTPGALSGIRLNRHVLQGSSKSRAYEGKISGVDFIDSFYQLGYTRMSRVLCV